MKNLKLKTLGLLFIFAAKLTFSQNQLAKQPVLGFGAQMSPNPIKISQPDNTKITVFGHGDKRFHYFETMDGYTILRNSKGIFEYAVLNKKEQLVCSGVKANNISNRSDSEIIFLEKIKAGLLFSKKQIAEIINDVSESSKAVGVCPFPSQGANNLLTILVDFSNTTPTHARTSFVALMNTPGYAGIGSFKDYFQEVSYNSQNINTSVVGWFTLPNTNAYYIGKEEELVRDAVLLADPFINFASFDNDGDGIVEGVHVIHQGAGQESTGNPLDIWSHCGSLDTYNYQQYCDGMLVNNYMLTPENYFGTTISGIGIICHEFGHLMGLPDFYDTKAPYTTEGTNDWDLMDIGLWLNNQKTPAHPNPWCKKYLGWVNPFFNVNPSIRYYSARPANQYPDVYQFDSRIPNEYFLLENRQLSGFDASLPNKGMLIWHIDENLIMERLPNNDVNSYGNPGVDLVEADGVNSYLNLSGDPYPGSTNNTAFNGHNSAPSARLNNGAGGLLNISNIMQNTQNNIRFKRNTASPIAILILEPIWERNARLNNMPSWFSPVNTTERGIAEANDHLYVTCSPRPPSSPSIKILNSYTGTDIGSLSNLGVSGGLFELSDVEKSANGSILACNQTLDASTTPFKIYLWSNEASNPVTFITYNSNNYHLGENFTLVGDIATNAILYAPVSNSNKVLKWSITNNMPSTTPIEITLSNMPSAGAAPSIAVMNSSLNSPFYVNGNFISPTEYQSNGTSLGSIQSSVISSNSQDITIFSKPNFTYLAAYQNSGLNNLKIAIINNGAVNVAYNDIVGSSPGLGMNPNPEEIGDIAIKQIGNTNTFLAYLLAGNNGLTCFLINFPTGKQPTNIEENNIEISSDIECYPNPFNENITFNLGNLAYNIAHIKISSTLGEVVYEEEIALKNGLYTVSSSDFPPGIYIYKVLLRNYNNTQNKLLSGKILKLEN
jgi:M6 family metalloprotease-like protein